FFLQAEDGIRDRNVTGVQTCALPIYFHLAVGLDVAGGDLALTRCVDIHRFHALAVKSCNDLLHVQHDLGDVFLDTGNGAELMLDTGDLDGGRGGTGQRRQQDPSEGVAQGRAVAALQRFHHVFAVGTVFRGVDAFNARLFNFYHEYFTLLATDETSVSLPISAYQ